MSTESLDNYEKSPSKKDRPLILALFILISAILFFGTLSAIVLYVSNHTSLLSYGNKIGVIPIDGVIKDSDVILDQLADFRKNKKISAIILRINSPGGGVGPSQEIYKETIRTAKTKKVIASLGSIAASGGYYIASAADKIVANPGTITGSIGVIMEFIKIEELLSKIGIQLRVIKSGEFKDIGSPIREMTDKEKQLLQGIIEDIKQQFVDAVAEGRNMEREKILAIADGRIFSGKEAKDLGLIDSIGNFRDAVDLAKEMVHIEGEAKLIFPEKKGKSFIWDLLFEGLLNSFTHTINQIYEPIEYRWNGSLGISNH